MAKANGFMYMSTNHNTYNRELVVGGRLKIPLSLMWTTWGVFGGILLLIGILGLVVMPYYGHEQPEYIYGYRFAWFTGFMWYMLATAAAVAVYFFGLFVSWWARVIKAAL